MNSSCTYRYLDPADRLAYQEELLRQLEVRNRSLAERVGQERAIANEFHAAGLELLDLINRARGTAHD
jgi:hypothetical protein